MKRLFAIAMCLALAALFAAQPVTAAETRNDIIQLNRPTGDLAVRTPTRPMEMLSSSDAEALNDQMKQYTQGESLLVNRAVTFFYYNNLDPLSKEIYDVLYQVALDPVSAGNIGLIMTAVDPKGDEFYYAFNLAYRAICFDHPELFWLYSGEEAEMGYYSEAISQRGFYLVYIMMVEPFTGFTEQMTAFNRAAEAFLADIDTGISEYDTVRQIHDKLIALVNYNDSVAGSVHFSKGQDLAHTAYGALVADSSGVSNCPVCDGYSLAFEYLLQQCGIDAVFIGGKAGSDEEHMGGHAWNVVKVDGVWYEVDSTWDDSDSMLDDLTPGTDACKYITEALNNREYREKIDHYLFLVSTERIRHFLPGSDYVYITKDQRLVFSLVDESVHVRLQDDGSSQNPDNLIISLAPIAMAGYRP